MSSKRGTNKVTFYEDIVFRKSMASTIYWPHYVLGVFTLSAAILFRPLSHRAEILGYLRPYEVENIHGEDLTLIPDTIQCEDLHHHIPSGLLFAGCQGSEEERFSWFPPLANFKDEKAAIKSKGGIYVVNPKVCTRIFFFLTLCNRRALAKKDTLDLHLPTSRIGRFLGSANHSWHRCLFRISNFNLYLFSKPSSQP